VGILEVIVVNHAERIVQSVPMQLMFAKAVTMVTIRLTVARYAQRIVYNVPHCLLALPVRLVTMDRFAIWVVLYPTVWSATQTETVPSVKTVTSVLHAHVT
jgi:hypothetical protein